MSEKQASIPDSIDRYQVLEKLGEGAMSIVYKAFDPEINRTLAIKLLRGECVSDSEYLYRFLSEAKAAGKLIHPNIVTIFDVGETKEGPYIAMEYLDGPTLEETMESDENLSTREIADLSIQLAEALQYSHENGIIHRDIKPSNIIHIKDQKIIKITDFGIAHIESAEKHDHTQVGTRIGTPQYMSPEQAEGLKVDARSDLFSVGVILYQLISGDKPFSAETLTGLLLKIVREDPVPIAETVPDIPHSLQKIVEKLLRKEPEKRFQSGRELADAVNGFILELNAEEQRKDEVRLMPLRVKWTMILAFLVSMAMIASIFIVHKKQVEAMSVLAYDFGSSLADFIAINNAEPVLLENWVAIETFIQQTEERQQLSYLKIVDAKGVVRGSTDRTELGRPYQRPTAIQAIADNSGVVISQLTVDDNPTLDFSTPILYRKRDFGRVHLGLSKSLLQQASDLTLYTMLGLMIAVVLTVSIAAYLLAARLSHAMSILKTGLHHIGRRNFSHRITEQRTDELGQLFNEFNKMSELLEMAEEKSVLKEFAHEAAHPLEQENHATPPREEPPTAPMKIKPDVEADNARTQFLRKPAHDK